MKNNTKHNTDDKIMSALARALADVDAGPHPSADEIALLVDGRLSDAERDRLMRHLASCPDCRELFLLTRSLNKKQRKTRTVFIPYAVAATVAIAISTFLMYERRGAEAPVPVAQMQAPVAPPSSGVSAQQKPSPMPDQPQTVKPAEPGSRGAMPPGAEPERPRIHLPLKQKDHGEGRIMVAQLELSDDTGKYLSQHAGDVVSDARGVKALVSKLGDEPRLADAGIRKVRIIHTPSMTKSFSFAPPKRAELKVQDGVLTIRLMEE